MTERSTQSYNNAFSVMHNPSHLEILQDLGADLVLHSSLPSSGQRQSQPLRKAKPERRRSGRRER